MRPAPRALIVFALAGCAHRGPVGPVSATILAINDFHGYLQAPSDGVHTPDGEVQAGGAAVLAAHLGAVRAAQANTVIVAAGDLIGASPLMSALFHDEPTIEAMNLIGLDILGVGNHEFDEGLAEVLRMKQGGCHPVDGCQGSQPFEGARFEFLAANVRRAREKETIFPPYSIRDMGGVPVAFLGLTLEDTPGVTPPTVGDLAFADEADTVNALVPELLAKGVRAIVVVLHEGGLPKGSYDQCEGLSGPLLPIVERLHPEVDVVVTGHTHQAYNCRIAGKVVTSAGCYGRLYTRIDLSLDPQTHQVLSAEAHNHIVTQDLKAVPPVEALVDHYQTLAAPIANRVVGRIKAEIDKRPNLAGESALGNLIADAQLEATAAPEKGGAVIAFMNSGGIRTGLDFAKSGEESEDGLVTYGELFAVQPFGNTVVTVTLTGEQLLQFLEGQWEGGAAPRFSQVSHTLRYGWDPAAPDGQHVDVASVQIAGQPLDKKAKYRIAVNSFMAQRGVLAAGEDLRNGPPDIEAFEAYLKRHSPLSPPALERIQRR